MESNTKQNTNASEPARPRNVGKHNPDALRLPFTDRTRISFGEWTYRHRVGLLVTIIVHLVAIIMFLTYQIIIKPAPVKMIVIEMVDEELQEPPKPEEPKPIEQLNQQAYDNVRNKASDANSKNQKEAIESRQSVKYKTDFSEVERVQKELASGQDAYRRGMAELEAMNNKRHRKTDDNQSSGKDKKQESAYVKGGVTVMYDLQNRIHTYLHVPAYQCEGGGQVVVTITVNRNGKVIAASVEKASSTDDSCILDMAVQAARASTFNASASAPDKQKGTITYMFVPQ